MREPLPVDRLREHLDAWELQDATVEPITPGATGDVFLLTLGAERWVAKFTYDYRTYFEQGLKASEIVAASTDYLVATPCLTTSGERVVMVEWPEGRSHPLAVLEFVPGETLERDDPLSAQRMGSVCGTVHRVLLEVDPRTLGIEPVIAPMEPPTDGWDLGDLAWLNDVFVALLTRATESIHDVRWTVAVWDGPDIRLHDGHIGLLDFGHTFWQPLVHAVANRSLIAAYGDERRLEDFLQGLHEHLELTAEEKEVFHLYGLINAGIYARWAAAHPNEAVAQWLLHDLVPYLRADLPRVGLGELINGIA